MQFREFAKEFFKKIHWFWHINHAVTRKNTCVCTIFSFFFSISVMKPDIRLLSGSFESHQQHLNWKFLFSRFHERNQTEFSNIHYSCLSHIHTYILNFTQAQSGPSRHKITFHEKKIMKFILCMYVWVDWRHFYQVKFFSQYSKKV